MFYYIYQITNLVNNNKIYVGVHKTMDMDDGYMGSGKVIKRVIEKYGIDNFRKDILEMFDDSDSMYAKEKELVTDAFLLREDTYNLRRGGTGGFDFINKNGLAVQNLRNPNTLQKTICNRITRRRLIGTTDGEIRGIKKRTAITKEQYSAGRVSNFVVLNSDPTFQEKRKIKFAEIGHSQGSKNSQFGTCWIYHELFGNKKCKLVDLPQYIDQGWIKGRFTTQI